MTSYEKAKARMEEIEQAWKALREEYSDLKTIVKEYESQGKKKEFIMEQTSLANEFAEKFPYDIHGNKVDFKKEMDMVLKSDNVEEVTGTGRRYGYLFGYSDDGYPCMCISYYGGGTYNKYFRTKASAKEYRDRQEVVRSR